MTEDDNKNFVDLSKLMSGSWVGFVVDQDPNSNGVEGVKQWPIYNSSLGGGLVINMAFTVNFTEQCIEWHSWRGGKHQFHY
jgi:hypothetical protein